jgi:ribosomal protein S18 acetylase RimI-like enzyme
MPRRRKPQLHITVRTAKAVDIAALSALASETYAAAFGHSMSAEDLAAQLRDTRSENYFEAALQTDAILLAFVGGALAGYLHIRGQPQDDDVEINALYVAPAMQGQGIGTALLEIASAHSRLADARFITLDVWEENPRAIAFYRRHGFEIAGKREFAVAGRVLGTDLVMRCSRLVFT